MVANGWIAPISLVLLALVASPHEDCVLFQAEAVIGAPFILPHQFLESPGLSPTFAFLDEIHAETTAIMSPHLWQQSCRRLYQQRTWSLFAPTPIDPWTPFTRDRILLLPDCYIIVLY